MGTAGILVAVLLLATFSEWIEERLFGSWVHGTNMIWLAAGIGVALCVGAKIGGLSVLGIDMNPWIDRVITGCIVGGGSNAVHQFFGNYLPKPPETPTTPEA